jgi:uncharacterized membrane protein
LIVLLLAATLILSAFHQPVIPVTGETPVSMQSKIVLPQTQDTDLSEVGSTTGIFIMGFVIVLITVTPLVLRKKK